MKLKFLTLVFSSLALMACNSDSANAESITGNANDPYKAGQQYEILPTPQPTNNPNKVEVAEVFWYGCGHCYSLEPFVKSWKKANETNPTVEFVRIPAPLNRVWKHHARMYYTAEALGKIDEVHDKIFEAIHVNKNRLATKSKAQKFFSKFGIDKETFESVYNEPSFSVDSRMAFAEQAVNGYGLSSVPAVIVNGKYKVTASSAGGGGNLFKVVDWLVEQEAKKLK